MRISRFQKTPKNKLKLSAFSSFSTAQTPSAIRIRELDFNAQQVYFNLSSRPHLSIPVSMASHEAPQDSPPLSSDLSLSFF